MLRNFLHEGIHRGFVAFDDFEAVLFRGGGCHATDGETGARCGARGLRFEARRS